MGKDAKTPIATPTNPVEQFIELLKAWNPQQIDIEATTKVSHSFLQLFSKQDHGKIDPQFLKALQEKFQTGLAPEDLAKIPRLFQLYVVDFITKSGLEQFSQDMQIAIVKNGNDNRVVINLSAGNKTKSKSARKKQKPR